MNRYQRLDQVFLYLAIATATVVGNQLRVYLDKNSINDIYSMLGILCFVALLTGILRHLLIIWAGESTLIRQAILGKQYVEGTWIDIIEITSGEWLIGIIAINAAGPGLTYGGENITITGHSRGTFNSTLIHVEWPTMVFRYKNSSTSPDPLKAGLVTVTFIADCAGPPARYTAELHDNTESEPRPIEAWKVRDKNTLAALQDPTKRTEAVLAFAQKSFPNIQL
jgi:hypothetical protein